MCLLLLRTSMGRLMHTVDRLEHDSAVTQPTSNLKSAAQAVALVQSTKTNTGRILQFCSYSTASALWGVAVVDFFICTNYCIEVTTLNLT